jgi:hypothetical protein
MCGFRGQVCIGVQIAKLPAIVAVARHRHDGLLPGSLDTLGNSLVSCRPGIGSTGRLDGATRPDATMG